MRIPGLDLPRPRRTLAAVVFTLSLLLASTPSARPDVIQGGKPTTPKETHFDSGGKKVRVWHYEPSKPGQYPAVLLLYGIDGLEEPLNENYAKVAKMIASKDYVVLLVHYHDRTRAKDQKVETMLPGLREILFNQGKKKPDPALVQHFKDWVAVVGDAYHYARTLKNVDGERLAAVGVSLGGFVGLSAAVSDPRVRFKAVISCFGGLPRELHAQAKGMPPTFIIHGTEDTIVPVKEAMDLCICLDKHKVPAKIHIDPVGHMWLKDKGIDILRAFSAVSMGLQFLDTHVKGVQIKKAP
jgi:dienelactone hydrolase